MESIGVLQSRRAQVKKITKKNEKNKQTRGRGVVVKGIKKEFKVPLNRPANHGQSGDNSAEK